VKKEYGKQKEQSDKPKKEKEDNAEPQGPT
jgi:hypothetical protein